MNHSCLFEISKFVINLVALFEIRLSENEQPSIHSVETSTSLFSNIVHLNFALCKVGYKKLNCKRYLRQVYSKISLEQNYLS